MKITFAGCGDAFGSGGRLNTCFYVEAETVSFLIDCGASAMVSLRRYKIDPNSISTIFISHLHGDHFAGLGSFLLDAQLISKRERDLTIMGPPGLIFRHETVMEAMFPGSVEIKRKFETKFVELPADAKTSSDHLTVTPFVADHACAAPPYALRIGCEGKILCYTGDTQWTDSLIPAGQGADLLIAECYQLDRKMKGHLDYQTLAKHLPEIAPKRVIVTHMSAPMLNRIDEVDVEAAYDGLVVEI